MVVIAGPPDVMAAMRLANRIRSTVGAPISLDGRQVELSLSVGIAEGVVGDDPERLIRRAEQAMARARHDGGDRTELFDGALAEESTRRHTIDQQLRNALDHDGLRVHFQPIIDIESDQVVAAEALLRVHDSDGTVMSPAEFVEAAESGGPDLPARAPGAAGHLRAAGRLVEPGRTAWRPARCRSTCRPASWPTPTCPPRCSRCWPPPAWTRRS